MLEKKEIKKTFGIVSSVVLILFGLVLIKGIMGENLPAASDMQSINLFASFTTTFFLAISNPMVIVWNASLLTAKALEYHYTKRELIVFGLAVGLAVLLFMGTFVILFSLMKTTVPFSLIQILNILVGSMLILYGTIRFIKVSQNSV